jgi:hypothetical protein
MKRILAGLLLLGTSPALAATPASGSAATLARDVDDVAAIGAIKRLQVAYTQYAELGLWSEMADLFADKGEAVLGDRTIQGRDAIHRYFLTEFGGGREGLPAGGVRYQLPLTPVINLGEDGHTAKGRWHELAMLGRFGGDASWTGGIYENDYVEEGGVWKIARLHYYPQFAGPYTTGWRNLDHDLKVVPYHYTPEQAGIPIPSRTGAVTGGSGATLAALDIRLDRMADEKAVRNLQNIYGYYVDRKMWDDVADLFEQGGRYTVDGTGKAEEGAAAIRQALERADGPAGLKHGEMNDHVQADMLVCVAPDGFHARTRGLDVGMTGQNDGKAYWSLTLFDTLFVKRDGRWRIAAMLRVPRMKTDYASGWGKSELVDPATASHELPPFGCWKDGGAPATPDMPLATAETRLRQVAARDAVENVSSAFGNYIDDSRWDDLGKLFTATGRREAPGVGFYVGPARITKMELVRYGPMKTPRLFIPVHARTQPLIDVAADGRSAKLRTRLLQFNTALERPGSMMAAIYEDDLVLDGGTWKFSSVEIDHTLQTIDYQHGWTAIPEGTGQRMIPPADKLLRDFPPDAPVVGEIYAPFPTIGLMWFHYANPVSGRPPPYLTPKTAAVVSRADERHDR